jgi:putative intracellular protease/amidase
LKGKRIAILATEGFEEVELLKPKEALEDAGATVDIVAPKSGIKSNQIKAWDMTDWGERSRLMLNYWQQIAVITMLCICPAGS